MERSQLIGGAPFKNNANNELDDAMSRCSSLMPNYLRMAMIRHELGSVATDLSALQSSRLYEPLDRPFVEDELLRIYDEMDQLIQVVDDYGRERSAGRRTLSERKLLDVQFKIRPLLERLDEDIRRMDKKVYSNLNCCKIKESRVGWLLNSHKTLEQLGNIVANLTLRVLDPLERTISLRLRGCDVPLVDGRVKEALVSARENLKDINFLPKQKAFEQS